MTKKGSLSKINIFRRPTMKNSSIYMAMFLLCYYGIAEAHTFDAHYHGPEETQLEEDVRKMRENREAQQTLQDNSSTEEEKDEARQKLYKNGAMI